MRVESVGDRMALIRHFVDRMPSYNINEIPRPAGSEPEPMTAGRIAKLWRDFMTSARSRRIPSHYYNLYIHLPFCSARCAYCMYDSVKYRSRSDVERYMGLLAQKMDFFGPLFERAAFQNVHVGGGTPTLLDYDHLERVLGRIFETFRLRPDASRVIECRPETITDEKASLLAAFGFNKISMGVQSLSRRVLESINRPRQDSGTVARAVERLRKAGLDSINCDLMMGLHSDDAATFLESLRGLMAMGPDTIMLAKVQPPSHYLRKHFGGRYERFVEFYDREFAGAVDDMLSMASGFGYEVDNPYPNELGWRFWKRGFRPPYDVTRPYYCTGGEHPSSCLGLGRRSKSKIFGTLAYEYGSVTSAFDKDRALFTGWSMDERYEHVRYLLNQISRSRSISRKQFKALYGRPLEEAFGPLLEELEGQGLAASEGDRVTFPTKDTKELFILSRLFLDRATLVASMAHVDREVLEVAAGRLRLELAVERCRESGPYLASASGLGLVLQESEGESDAPGPFETAVEFSRALFLKIASHGPGLTAFETAGHMARRMGALKRMLPAGTEVAVSLKK
jgi:coproporphyrinogen III oxidase-like Fe-S oxidoreductase